MNTKTKTKEIGKKYGRLTVLSYSHTNNRHEIMWKCQCECGNTTTAKTSDLRSGHKASCGCLYSADLSGQKFGLLTVIEKAYTKNGILHWKCRCECGQETFVGGSNLKRGNTSSCGCINYSIGENNIKKWLEKNNINYLREWRIPNTNYRFDFAIFDKNDNLTMFIEFDGEQHFTTNKGYWKNKETLEKLQQRDLIKNQYAIENNIPLVRIPYWERDNIKKKTIFNPNYFVNLKQ